jgi:hypothetical protein
MRAWLLLSLFSVTDAFAGWTATQVNRLEGAAESERAVLSFADDRLRIDSGDRSYVVDMKAGSFLFLDHANQRYASATAEDIVGIQKKMIATMKAQLGSLPEGMRPVAEAQIAALEKSQGAVPKVDRTGKKDRVGAHACEIVTWTDQQGTSEACVSKDLPVDVSAFLAASASLAKRLSALGAGSAAGTSALFHLPGLPLRTKRSTPSGVNVSTIENLAPFTAKPDTFAAPAKYAKRSLEEMMTQR